MSDGTKRKLTMPTWHIPYLEKHRIYDLFNEIARELVIQQPTDHLLFLKHILCHAAKSRDIARVVILSSPKVNCYEVARQISIYTKQAVIGENAVLAHISNTKGRDKLSPSVLIKHLRRLIRTDSVLKTGWIVVDCIKNSEEAKAMIEAGILPTHVIHLIPPFMPPLNKLLYCDVSKNWPGYRRTIMGVRDVYKSSLIEVFLQERDIEEIVLQCVDLIKLRVGFGGPCQPRVLIIGPRGCGRKTQARLLAENLNLVHIDFEYLLCQAWISESTLGKKLRACRDEVCFQSELLSQIVSKKVLEKDCLEKGWILTGFPYTANDFKYLDCLDTPPNRVIFLDCHLKVCRERLVNRKMNIYTGSVTNVTDSTNLLDKVLGTHPKDQSDIIDAELNYYCEHYGSLRSYCGETAHIVNGDQNERWVCECISAIIVRPAIACAPRNPCEDEYQEKCPCPDSITNSTVFSPVIASYINLKNNVTT